MNGYWSCVGPDGRKWLGNTPMEAAMAAQSEARDPAEELRHIRDTLAAAVVEQELTDALANFIKVKGRHHTEQAYLRLVTAYDAHMNGGTT
jgi:hypothetical protein